MSYYEQHIFICTNQREGGKQCCANQHASETLNYLKTKIKLLELNGKGKIRINNAGCMDRCVDGPVLVVYPQGVWYQYKNFADIDEIIEQHLIQGKIVERLVLKL